MQRPGIDDDDVKAFSPLLHLGPRLEERQLDNATPCEHNNRVLIPDLLLRVVRNNLAGHVDPLADVPVNGVDEVLLLRGLVLAVLGVGVLAELRDLALEPADGVSDANSLRTARLEVRNHGRDVRAEVLPVHACLGALVVADDLLERGEHTVRAR